ncbi:hypothetical protein STEG23_031801 [Scotinomys teguina]
MFVGLGWSFDKPEASDASWRRGHWWRPHVRPTQPRKEQTLGPSRDVSLCTSFEDTNLVRIGNVMERLSKSLNISWKLHIPYCPQSSGKAEKANELIKQLTKLSIELSLSLVPRVYRNMKAKNQLHKVVFRPRHTGRLFLNPELTSLARKISNLPFSASPALGLQSTNKDLLPEEERLLFQSRKRVEPRSCVPWFSGELLSSKDQPSSGVAVETELAV